MIVIRDLIQSDILQLHFYLHILGAIHCNKDSIIATYPTINCMFHHLLDGVLISSSAACASTLKQSMAVFQWHSFSETDSSSGGGGGGSSSVGGITGACATARLFRLPPLPFATSLSFFSPLGLLARSVQ